MKVRREVVCRRLAACRSMTVRPGKATVCIVLLMDTPMRTNIVIDDELMAKTLLATGLKTKKEVVELGLKTLLRLQQQAAIRQLRGRVQWEGDLDAMRTDR